MKNVYIIMMIMLLCSISANAQFTGGNGDGFSMTNRQNDLFVIIYVDASASGSNDGTSWANAFTSFQSALDAAVSGKQIWVAAGTYKPSSAYDLSNTSRYYHFRMVAGVEIYGGFAGTETATSQRTDFGSGGTNETILSGDLSGDDVVTGSGATLSFSNNTENCYHVFYHPSGWGLTTSAILDGFTVSGGNANGSNPHNIGGGMRNYSNSPTIRNCNIKSNSAIFGGGFYNSYSSPVITNSTVSGNFAGNGGGFYNLSSSLVITNSTINGNKADYRSGGVFNSSSSPVITNSTISGNNAGGAVGGGFDNFNSSPTITNSTISRNSAETYGGGFYNENSSPVLTNSIISNNTANYSGGGFYNYSSSSPALNNSIIWGNTASSNGKQFHVSGGTTTLNYSCYSNGAGDVYTESGGVLTATNNNITSDPKFYNAVSGDYRITSLSPCLDAGDNSYTSETYDIRGTGFGRKLNKTDGTAGTIDMGAYEFKFGTDPTAPAVTTQAVSSIAATTATGNGNITSLGIPSPTAHGVVYNTATNPTTANSVVDKGAASSTSAFTASITGLSVNTQYFVKAYATNTAGTVYGDEVNFYTLANVPSAPTVNNATTTTLDVAINVNGNNSNTEFAIYETSTSKYVQTDGTLGATAVWKTEANWETFATNTAMRVTGLSANTQYTFEVKARNGESTPVETDFSGTTSLYTLAIVPSAPTVNNATTTTLDVAINSNGNPAGTEFAIQETGGTGRYVQTNGTLGDDGGDAVWQTETQWEVNAGNTAKTVIGLTPNTQYTFQVKARNGNNVETAFGSTANGTTLPQAPTVTTQAVSSIESTTATGNGNITDLGIPNPTAHGVCWNTTGSPTILDSKTDEGAKNSTGEFISTLTNLSPNTVYYVRAYATNSCGTGYGEEFTFTTDDPQIHDPASWFSTTSPKNVNEIVTYGSNLFASTDVGVYRSSDNGSSWTAVNSGLTNREVLSLAANGSNLYAGTEGGVFLSTNNGASWTAVNTGLTNIYVRSLLVSGSNLYAGTYGGVFLSTNNGTSWTAVNSGLTNTSVNSLLVSGSNLYAGTSGGVFLSTDNGSSWTAVNSGLTNTSVSSLAVNGSNLYAGTYSGDVFLSTNNGSSWSAINSGLTTFRVLSLLVSGSNLYAGTDGRGVFLSTNNGSSWSAVNSGLTNTDVRSLAVSGSNLYAGTGGGVFLSTDDGSNWTAVNSGLSNATVSSLAVNGSNFYAGTYGGVFLSTDNGSSWVAVNSGLTNKYVQTLTANGSNLYAGTLGGVFLSTNNGSSWTAVNSGLTNTIVRSFLVSGSNLYAGTQGGGVFLSTDDGSNWVAVNSGLTNTDVRSLLVSGSNLYAATSGGGVFLSTNNGSSWTAVNSGLTSTYVNSLAVSGGNLYASTWGGVFLSSNNGSSWSAVNTGLANIDVRSLLVSGSNVYAGTYGGGVFLRTNNGSSWTAVNSGLTNTQIYSLLVSGNNLYAGTYSGGVNRHAIFTNTFTDTDINTNSAEQSFFTLGSGLQGDITITAPAGFQVSLSSGAGYAQSVTVSPSGKSVNPTDIYVRFSPTAAQSYSGNITLESDGATTRTLAVQGLGLAIAPILSTTSISEIASTSAKSGGNVTNLNGANPTAHGVCWNTTGSPTTSDSKTDEGTKNSTGEFISTLTNLAPNTVYYVRAYATNSGGTGYGEEVSFRTYSSPELANLDGNIVSFVEGGSPAWIDANSDVSITDADASGYNTGNLTVSVTDADANDDLIISTAGTVSLSSGMSNTSVVSVSGTDIGTITSNGQNGSNLVVGLNASATNTNIATLIQNIQFANDQNDPPASKTANVTLTDASSTSSITSAVTVNITGVNDAPTMSVTSLNPSHVENGSSVSLYSSASISTVESGQLITGFTIDVTNVYNGSNEKLYIDGSNVDLTDANSLTTAGNSLSVSVSVSINTATVTLSKIAGISAAAAQTIVNGITYRNTSENPNSSSRVITITGITDNGGTANGGSDNASLSLASTVTITPINDAPVLSTTASPTLTGISEDLGTPSNGSTANSTLVSSLIDNGGTLSNYTDAEGNSPGIAITAVNQGTLYYSTNDGTNWASLGEVSATSGLLLNADATTRVYFKPSADINGTVTNAIVFKAWDRSSGSNGDLAVNTTVGTSFSSSTDNVAVAVSSINDDPSISSIPSSFTFDEDVMANFDLSAVTVADVDAGPNSVTITLTAESGIFSASTSGGVTIGGSSSGTLTLSGTVSNIDTYLNTASNIKYTGASNANGSPATTVSIKINDNGYSGNGGGLDVNYSAKDININAINDAPVLSNINTDNETITVTYSGNIDVSQDVSLSDVDSPDFNAGSLIISQTSGTTNGSFSVDGTTVLSGYNGIIAGSENISVNGTPIGTVHALQNGQSGNSLNIAFNANASTTLIETLIKNIKYTAPSGLGDRDFTLTLTDGDGIANGGDDDVSVSFKLTIIALLSEINLKQATDDIADGGSYNWGNSLINQNHDIVFTIENSGEGDLSITLPLSIGGVNASDFSVSTQPSATVTSGNSTTFTVRFNPAAVGAKTASIAIANNDSDENPYNITLNGAGVSTPSTQASDIQFSNITRTSMTVRWAKGDGDGSILLAKEQYRIANTPLTDGTPYTGANVNYASASTVGGAKMLYNGSDENPSINVTGLNRYKLYYFRAFGYNNTETPFYLQTENATNPRSRWTLRRDGMMEEDLTIDAEYPYPNPVSSTISTTLDVFEAGNVSALLYDASGRLIKELYNKQLAFGTYELKFNLSDISSGVYQLIITKGSEAVVYPLSVVR